MEPADHPPRELPSPAVLRQLPPPPRVVARRPGRRRLLGHVPLAVQLLCVAGVGLLLLALWQVASTWFVSLFGVTSHGELTSKSAARGKGAQGGRVQFTYHLGGEEYSSEDTVDEADFDGLQVGMAVKVRVLPSWPSRPLLVEPPGHAGRGGGVWLCLALLGNVALLALARVYLRMPLRQRALVRAGVAVEGVVVGKEVGSGRRPSWSVQFCYRAPRYGADEGHKERTTAADREWQVRMAVGGADFQAAQVGAAVTVLYDPHQPSRSLIYAFAEYEAVDTPEQRPA